MRHVKHHLKMNPLATAILTLLCGSSASSYAASTVSSDVNAEQLKQRINETCPGEARFSQYYVDHSWAEAQQRQGQYLSSAYCEGAWVTPIAPDAATIAPDQATSTITADYGHYNPAGDSYLEGNVVIDQQGRQIRAERVTIDQTQTYAKAAGQVQLAQGGLI